MRVEQVALPVLRWVNGKPRLAPALDRLLQPFNPFSRTLNVDPYPAYERLRAEGPMVFHRGLNTWLVTSHELCEEVLRSPASVDRGDLFDVVSPWSKLSPTERATFTRSLLLVDPPDHTRLRKLVSRAFTPRTVERIEPRIREIAEGLVAKAALEDRVDLFAAVFAPLPIYVIGELLGIPEDDWDRLKGWSDELAKVIDPVDAFVPAEMARAVAELDEALDGWIAVRRAALGDDLLSKLLEAESDDGGGRLDRAELRSMVAILMTAGHETTSGLLGNAVVALDGRPDLRERLASDADVAGPAVEELLRFDSPVQNTDRMVQEPMTVGGCEVKPGQQITMLIGAANRDPQRFDRPAELDFDRPDNRPLSFGHGIHHCIGAALARQEAKTVLPLLYRELPAHRVDVSGVRWKRSMTLRGPVRLPVQR
ncbi:cytochrome P450 [Aquihabitans sp. G128]|uniref:cytochrome P450 n=1 Tax=Aquihabitans sp. G128 TaxID=2849779 RepID=UPI001C21C73A|nr:cytochrome P450 [Aquihabitans sp. G128]QXC60777.1 cytochrome P450 [Aquihabitans sp. G128]